MANKCNTVTLMKLLTENYDNQYLVDCDNTDKLKLLNHQISDGLVG